MKGYITKGIGGFYYVKTPEGIVECKPRGIFRKQKITPVAGDEVTLETENGAAVIAEIAPRKNVFVRPPVANLDVLFLVASTTQPTPSTLVLDKLAAIAVDKGVQPVIVCTKGDLAEAEFLRKAYERSTLPFIRIDYETGGGLDEVKQWISGRLCAFCGNSGVGKSTLFNVLAGDMSLVGPRPEIPRYVDHFKYSIPLYMVRHQVRPGITGWAQVNGLRGDTSIRARVDYDLYYIENWSMLFDIKILLMTPFKGVVNHQESLK